MKNKEFYRDEIFEITCKHDRVAIANGKLVCCMAKEVCCEDCDFFKFGSSCNEVFFEWLEKEHEEPRIQPEVKTLKQDDRVLVSANGVDWIKRHFEKYDQEENVVYVYTEGATSWTENQGSLPWKYAKLPEAKPEAKPEIDWTKVPVDAKIFVKQCECEEWVPRHFAKFENRAVYAWVDGKTSHTTKATIKWTSAKLAEDKE